MNDSEPWLERFERLNGWGKAYLIAETGIQAVTSLVESAVDYAVDAVHHAEKAFLQGHDPNIEDAKILEEVNRK